MRTPLLLISGAGPTVTTGKGHFQDLDQVALARPIARLLAAIGAPERTAGLLNQAFAKATADPRGPVHLIFPLDVQVMEAAGYDTGDYDTAGYDKAANSPVGPGSAGIEPDLREMAGALSEATAPLVIAGSGIFYNRSGPEVLRFCTYFGIPAIAPIRVSPGWGVCATAR